MMLVPRILPSWWLFLSLFLQQQSGMLVHALDDDATVPTSSSSSNSSSNVRNSNAADSVPLFSVFSSLSIQCGSAVPYNDTDGIIWEPDGPYLTYGYVVVNDTDATDTGDNTTTDNAMSDDDDSNNNNSNMTVVGSSFYTTCPQTIENGVIDEDLYCRGRVFEEEFSNNSTSNTTDDNNNTSAISSVAPPHPGYEIPVPFGLYTVTFHFAEVFLNSNETRIFDVVVEGRTVAQDLDLFQMAGESNNTAIALSSQVLLVMDGSLTIELIAGLDHPILSALQVQRTPLESINSTMSSPMSVDAASPNNGNVNADFFSSVESVAQEEEQAAVTDKVPQDEQGANDADNTSENNENAEESKNDTEETPDEPPQPEQPDEEASDITPTYIPGLLTVQQDGLILSQGLSARRIAESGQPVWYASGESSDTPAHTMPDGAACYPDPRDDNEGGWIYVSNAEARPEVKREYHDYADHERPGGVGAFTFDKDGNLLDYRMILQNTIANCGGGKTPWDTWISCEEIREGLIFQVDPTGRRDSELTALASEGPGYFESFAYDVRNRDKPYFFVTKDHDYGDLRRFTPNEVNWDDPWNMLTREGTLEYLVVEPNPDEPNTGTFRWTSDRWTSQSNAVENFRNAEGIDVRDNELFVVSKKYRTMFILDLDQGIYANYTTEQGLFDAQPDQIKHLIQHDEDGNEDEELLLFTEDGGPHAGLHARNTKGQFVTILESHAYTDETTGLALSPNAKVLYIAYQVSGLTFAITRDDGLPFHASALDVKYHSTDFEQMR